MRIIERIFWVHLVIAVAAMAAGFGLLGYGPCSGLLVLAGAGWLLAQQRKMVGLESLFLFGFVISAGIGFWLQAAGWLMLLGVVAALGAWDLYTFLLRLGKAQRVEFNSGLGRAHIRRLGLVEIAGLLVGLIGLTLQLDITFWWQILLIFVAVPGLSYIVYRIRKETE